MNCGVKILGPKSHSDSGFLSPGCNRSPDQSKEYLRLFHKFQRLRAYDDPDDIARLVVLVENGVLKEEGNRFFVCESGADGTYLLCMKRRLMSQLRSRSPRPLRLKRPILRTIITKV